MRRFFAWTHSSRWLTALNVLAIVGLCIVSGLMLWDSRVEAGRRMEASSRSLLQVLWRDIARNIELYDLSLRAVVDGMKLPAVVDAPPDIRQMILFDRAATAENFGHTVVTDSTGRLIINSRTLEIAKINYADRAYFQYHATHPEGGLHISEPLISRSSGHSVLVLSRRLSNPDGSFAGVVVGSVHLDYFRQLFAAVGDGTLGTITLMSPDGAILMREPDTDGMIGTDISRTESYRRIASAKTGSFTGPAMSGDGERRFVFTQVGDLPLRLSLAVRPAEVYASWWHKALGHGSVVLCLCAIAVLMNQLFRRELQHRQVAERAAAEMNVELARLALTDGLTGLPNRRRFDEALDRDCRRAARQGHPLSLLMIDADCFKGYNDRYGHQAGDTVLQRIAESLRAVSSRPCDIGCRFGGEEFALILPETDANGARIVAERLRELVQAHRMPHDGNPHGVVTVSIGVAQAPATPDPAQLIAAADTALYAAKGLGRNRVWVAEMGGVVGVRARA